MKNFLEGYALTYTQIRRAERREAFLSAVKDCAASLLAIAVFFVLMFFVEG